MVRLSRTRLSFGRAAIPVWGGALAALAAGLFFVLLPDWRLEQAVDASGLPHVLSLAQPPLGNTARLLLAVIAAVVAGAVGWAALFLLFGPGGAFARVAPPGDRPTVRRADAHPDAPPRHPLTAAELGTPPPAERDIPADWDQPLAAFDPDAIPAVPIAPPVPPPAAPKRVVAPPPPPPPPPTPPPPPVIVAEPASAPMPRNDAPPPSIAALLDRLEKGTRRR